MVRPPRPLLLVVLALALAASADKPIAQSGCQTRDYNPFAASAEGAIDASDCVVLPHRNAYGEIWGRWHPNAGDRMVFTMRRGTMADPYLLLVSPTGQVVAANDDFDGTQDASIDFTAPATGGPYTVIATSFAQTPATDFGTYRLIYNFGPPSARNLSATVTGSQVALAWDVPFGPTPPNYILQAGNTSGVYNLFTGSIGGVRSLVANNLPNGAYYWRLIGDHSTFQQPPSDEAFFQIGSGGPCTPPGPPANFNFSVTGLQVTLQWQAPASGGPPTTYIVEAGSAPDLANLYNAPTGSTATALAVSAPPGLYYVRVRARNACGTSLPSTTHAIGVGVAPPPSSTTTTTTIIPGPTITTTTTTSTVFPFPFPTTTTTVGVSFSAVWANMSGCLSCHNNAAIVTNSNSRFSNQASAYNFAVARSSASNPDNSTFLIKASGGASHGGFQQWPVGSAAYNTAKAWMSTGMSQ
jgi:hypothetical protein